MKLISVYERHDRYALLYELLKERDEKVNISHRELPSWLDHIKFVDKEPYKAWYFICDPEPVGACYLTHNDEIGVFIFRDFHKRGYGRKAVQVLMKQHGPRRYLANINPDNSPSRFLFAGLGFKLVQNTYECVPGS